MSNETLERPTTTAILPFGIEIDHPRNCDCIIQSVPGLRLRSRITASRTVKDKNGDERVPQDQAKHLGAYPEVPGMQLHVNPMKGAYQVIDPLNTNPDLCERLKKRIEENSPYRTSGKIRGVETQHGELDPHRMKTLVREMLRLIDSGEAKLSKGTRPTEAEVEGLPGNFLLNPGSLVHNTQPTFEKDWDEWVANLTLHGG